MSQEKNVKIFDGKAEDLRPIADLWSKEAGGFGIGVNVDEHLADLQDLIDSPDKDLLVLYNGNPIGYMGIIRFKNPLGKEYFANEHYWYIAPERRGGTGAVKLIQAAQEWALQKGCQYLLMSASRLASPMHDKVCRLYEKLGFEHFETTYIKGI